MILRSDIQMRDPFVVLIGDKYYLYGTTDKDCWSVPATGFDAYVSDDLEHFEGPFPVFRPDANFWADRHYWAPEMHIYRGEYYLFASFKAEGVCRHADPQGGQSPWPLQALERRPCYAPRLGVSGRHTVCGRG